MTAKPRSMHLGAFLFQVGHHVAAWRSPHSKTEQIFDFDFYKQFAQTAERAKFDMIFLADTLAIPRKHDAYLKHAVTIRPEPLTLLSMLTGVTERIGLAATVSTTYHEPYNLAREFATLDHLSGGRSAWNVVTSSRDEEARNFSREKHLDHGPRYARAREFVQVASKLWDSWQDDAVVIDTNTGLYADPSKVQRIDHKGEFFSVRGPLNVHRPPQGRPVIIQAGSSDTGISLAAETAEVVFTAWQTLEEAQSYYRKIKERMKHFDRAPESLKVMPGILPIIGATEKEAREKEQHLQELVVPEVGLAMLSASLNTDLSGYSLDGPLPDLPQLEDINGGKSRFKLVSDIAKRDGLTLRQLMYRVTGARGHRTITGMPEYIAAELESWFEGQACDGFNIMPPYLPGGLDDFAQTVIPILQEKGLFRTAYTGSTLRDHLGLERPAARQTVQL
ncbi:LLM class flavin-dependent oxidoreductase [Paenibacillus lemnae]|uniref:LLM class flavin-dependent oxidoreductase n=1 Tax=Paenibacillus lemnae TaxID=1330551 RepID=A0A848M5L3_PAELE|nr:LLM class flavin-dependent oxidoreductase [Paenibacillus lemnae]NMO94894.1 LLM class flavin-dependent oxidoreductase [Paenibacillus lemnae]